MVLGCSCDDPLQSLDFSLSFHWVVVPRHLLVAKAAILHAVWIVEKEARFIVLVGSSCISCCCS